ncbi:two-component system sensor histidine kinase KdpD [Glaciihabitans tibetensis]|uniref:histidine kinase n=1 Tax=Glaciihabitans tibetensis TaxID=1266600 RepID=A0A2T0VJ86_9MICO|nr:ATP-binding protein [Glaciihabitans tibetensis]PRY70291.1 two-component system sensor histidine kinase KdpD [Glaciihabitans tibetensis]
MTRGSLRVMLGAAPGVGKTYAMLEEGRRLRDAGKDVVIGVLETHGRAATAALVGDLEVIPRRHLLHRGVSLDELDLAAVLVRNPDLVLVDELAHTNAPGSANAKRWEDVAALLDAGIDVLSTVNVQHIESLNDVVEQITGVPQRETIPDAALRRADQIELVDLAPQSLRDRLAEGFIYPAARVDAALSNYFRLGNLTALRELALLWLADEVDVALQAYRSEHGIDALWEARERIVVALTGGPEGETLLRRGARIAARTSGGQLFAVYVSRSDGLAERDPAALTSQRALVETLGGSYHQVVAEDVPAALVDFARGVGATQLVIGVSRRSRWGALVGGAGTGATIIRLAADIDVHIVSHPRAGARRLPRSAGALSRRRQLAGLATLFLGLPLLTLLLVTLRSDDSMTSDVLGYQLLVVIVALVGGLWPALLAAAASALVLDFFFVAPLHTVTVSNPLHLIALAIFVLVATLVSVVVDQAARRSTLATRSTTEADLLVTIAGSVIGGEDALQELVSRLREAFGMASVMLRQDGQILYLSTDAGTLDDTDEETSISVGTEATLQLRGRPLAPKDRRILDVFVAQLETALEQRRLASEVAAARPIAAADRLRSALLAAVGHDLRRPLASATTAVTALRATDVRLSEDDRDELLETAEQSLASLSTLVIDLLDASRLQAGVLGLSSRATECEEIVLGALDELGLAPGEVTLRLEPVAPVYADPALLQRVVVNLLTNAIRFSPSDTAPTIATSEFGGKVQLRVVDSGPGIPVARRREVFEPFQRLGDTDNTSGVGLGLALAKGFTEAMNGTLEVEDTPGGGLTMVVELPEAR